LRQESTDLRSSVILPKPSGKEKKKGYFSKVVKSLKSLNKYIYKTKTSQGIQKSGLSDNLKNPTKDAPTDLDNFADQFN